MSAATNSGVQNGFILIISLSGQPSPYIESGRAPLTNAISKKYRVVNVYTSRDALAQLSAFGLAGVIIADGGVAEKKTGAQVLPKVAQYARSGGTVIAGLAFSSYVNGDDFQAFFKAFGLPWRFGSYHRQEFYLDTPNAFGNSNPLLDASYSMKALQAEGITANMAIYQSTRSDGTPTRPSNALVVSNQSQPYEAPIVMASVGEGKLGYLGDVNDERASMNVYLAMLGILDANTCIDTSAPPDPVQPITMSFADMFPQFTRPARSVPPAKTTSTAAPFRVAQAGASTRPVPTPRPPPTDPTVAIVALDGQAAVIEEKFKHQLDALRSKVKLVVTSRSSEVLQGLASESTVGVYLVDGGILKWKNKTLYPKLVDFAEAGGKIVCGGTLPATLTAKTASPFFEAFGLSWTAGGTRAGYYELLPRNALAKSNPGLFPNTVKLKPQNIADITIDVPVYTLIPNNPPGSEDEEPFDAPVLHVKVGLGSLGYIGDLNGGAELTPLLLAMFDLLKKPASAAPPTPTPATIPAPAPARAPTSAPVLPPGAERQPRKFAILVNPSNISPLEVEYEYSDLIKKVEEKLELVRGLSADRIAELISSPGLTTVIVCSASIAEPSPAMAHLKSKLVEFTTKGKGTLIFLRSFSQDIGIQASREFFLNHWGLDWTSGIRKSIEKEVRLNETNGLVNGRRKKWLPKTPQWEGAATFTSTRTEDVVYVPAGWQGEGFPGFAQWDGERGRYFEGPVLYASVGDGGKGRIGFVGGMRGEEETVKVVVTMIVSGF